MQRVIARCPAPLLLLGSAFVPIPFECYPASLVVIDGVLCVAAALEKAHKAPSTPNWGGNEDHWRTSMT